MSKGQINHTAIPITCSLIWIGLICGISLLETWVKYNTSASPDVVWLEFGNQLFGFLNKVEWLIALLIILSLVMFKDVVRARNIWLLLAILILTIQSIWFLPQLRENLLLHIHGQSIKQTVMSKYYLFLEVLKIFVLFVFAIMILMQRNKCILHVKSNN
jgi:hypothetical protein